MNMIDTLFGLIPEASRGQQWVAQDLQLVNWGGYEGHHRVRFAPGATLLCGESGSGKSTLMDSYIALIMPHTMPFNGASNGGVVGRPRGKDQRNILSYARGKLDESRTGGETKAQVLRGDGWDTWSAIAMTWADRSSARFTAVRAWYVPSSARSLEDLVQVRATCDEPFDLRELAEPANKRFAEPAVKALGLTCYTTDREYTARLHTALGIGAAGDGNKAVALLGRIQAGQQITTVDALYKTMVLEEPSTLSTADEVVKQFDELSSTRKQMTTARQQVRALTPIREYRSTIHDAIDRLRMIEAIGSFTDSSSPAWLWRHERRVELLRAAEEDLRRRREQAKQAAVVESALAEAAKSELDGVAETLRSSGGDRLDRARSALRDVDKRLEEVSRVRTRLDQALKVLDAEVSGEEDFAALVVQARRLLDDKKARETTQNHFADAKAHLTTVTGELADLRAERKAVAARRGNIPTELHRARAAFAEVAGLTPDDLPFVGELIEVRTVFEPWREAFNLALAGFAIKMLIDIAHLSTFREKINTVRTARRIQFEGVPTGLRDEIGLDDRTLPGRLDYRPSPFTAWLKSELVNRFDYVCVETPRLLPQHPKALTITGQISDGARGAHGGQGRANVLGFTNDRLLAHLDKQIRDAEENQTEASDRAKGAQDALDSFEDRRSAYRTLTELSWDQVDVDSVSAERDRWMQIIDEVHSDNPEIDRLQKKLDALEVKVNDLAEKAIRAKVVKEDLDEDWKTTADEAVDAQQQLDIVCQSGREVTSEHRDYLTELFDTGSTGDISASEAVTQFDTTTDRVADRLRADRQTAVSAIARARTALSETFSTFVERWPNPNLGTDPDASYDDFERLLTDLETSRLHELETQWRDSLLKLSGNDLTSLDSELASAIREIRDRIEPVNRILAELPFSDNDHRLQIDPQESHSAVRARFRKEMRDVRRLIDQADTDTARERAYGRMAKVIDRIRRTAPDFADLIDVRNHIRISAEKRNAANEHVALYDHIGEKSGGESQELVAFIVGSALRYQLGDAGAERPRYAPVFLDEALIKADARYTGRAIGAWRGLGFQLIVGAPNDKNSAIEPHVEAEYLVLKDAQSRSWAKLIIGVPGDDE
ncbi:ATP-binding protein [Nocardia sp. XZ_19_369]|uniref:ATP-binding protein n=1 Tax=Nocardia sp. XZ_19_369 TaxID=2769487 RepID=UPI00188E9317|nr:SbcC/MukB-like Walker B domain-containing protein [Nocardia sp. XZ_19_369]